MALKKKTINLGIRFYLLSLTLISCLSVNLKSYGQTINDTICLSKDDFKLMMIDLHQYQILRTIDSNNMVIIATQKDMLSNAESVMFNQVKIIANKDIQLNLLKSKARRDKWIIGGTLGAGLLIGILTAVLIN